MKTFSKSTVQKTVIAATALVCIVMGQNCGRTTQFSAINEGMPSMKDVARSPLGDADDQTVSTMLPPSYETPGIEAGVAAGGTQEQEQGAVAAGETGAQDSSSITSDASSGAAHEVTPPKQESQVAGTGSNETQQPEQSEAKAPEQQQASQEPTTQPTQNTAGSETPSSDSDSGTDSVCMDIKKVDAEDLKKVASVDDHGHAKDILICHNVAHNPKEHMVHDGQNLKAHLGHGDYIGACGQPVVPACQEQMSTKKAEKEHGQQKTGRKG